MAKTTASSHFTQLRDWSGRKHTILEKYLRPFCQALSGQVRGGSIWYVDGFAGAGVYRDPLNPADPGTCGSPVLAARITRDLTYPIKCLNVEEQKENFESLQHETKDFSHVTNINNDFNVVIDQVLATVEGCPTFFFLDPFGTKALPMEGLVDRIAMRKKPTDILLRYDTLAVKRLVGNYQKDPVRGGANARNLDKWFGGQGWRDIVDKCNGDECEEALIRYYRQQLVSISNSRLQYSRSYPIRSIEGSTKYHLVFATGDRLGIKLMNDILYQAESQYGEEYKAHQEEKRGGQTSMFALFAEDLPSVGDDKATKLQKSILDQAQNRKDWEFEALQYALMEGGWFVQFTEKHLRAACKALCEKGLIVRKSAGRGWSKGTEFIIQP